MQADRTENDGDETMIPGWVGPWVDTGEIDAIGHYFGHGFL